MQEEINMFGKKEYPNLENALEKKGYYITGKWETPSTRLINTLGKKKRKKKIHYQSRAWRKRTDPRN